MESILSIESTKSPILSGPSDTVQSAVSNVAPATKYTSAFHLLANRVSKNGTTMSCGLTLPIKSQNAMPLSSPFRICLNQQKMQRSIIKESCPLYMVTKSIGKETKAPTDIMRAGHERFKLSLIYKHTSKTTIIICRAIQKEKAKCGGSVANGRSAIAR